MTDPELGDTYLQVMWPEIVYTDNGESPPGVEQVYRAGSIVNSTYCPVTQKWYMLIAGIDGQFHSVPHDQEGLVQQWVTEVIDGD